MTDLPANVPVIQVDYNNPCAVCGARIVLHPMFLADGGPNLRRGLKCPGGEWITWHEAIGLHTVESPEAVIALRSYAADLVGEETPMNRLEYRKSLGLDNPLRVGEETP